MKKIILYNMLAAVLVFTVSCDNGFDELNTNKTAATAIDPAFELNNAVVNLSFRTGSLVYEVGIVQQIISPNSGVLTGANYNQDNRNSTQENWQAYYRFVIRYTRDVIKLTEGNVDRANLRNMARIVQAYGFMLLTDSYGDIPYTDGGTGYTGQVFFPKYQTQQEVYTDIIKELTEASAALGAAGARVETADVLYVGDIAKWKKFGYSLLLRAGMRLSKANPTLAKSTVEAAFAGGVILTNADNAYMRHDANYLNPIPNTLNSTEAANFYLTEPFVNYLKNNTDPRLSSIAIRYVGATSGPTQTTTNGNTTAAVQIGMPMGNDNTTVAAAATSKGLVSFYEFSQADRRRVVKPTSPCFFVTAGQTNLLLAEAAHNGWTVGATTKAVYFSNGIRAHMEQMATYDPLCTIAAADITTYLGTHPLTAGSEIDLINTQYWVASFLNGPEAFANFRRTGFPALAPNPFPGKGISGTFIRRLTYPNSEISVNSANVQEAIARQGTDNLDTKVWWDKP